jgi:hypothetical protein
MAPIRMLKKHRPLRIRGGGDNDNEGTQRRRKWHYYNFTVKQKISIVQEAYSKPGYVYRFAKKIGIARASAIRKCKKNLNRLKEKALHNPHAKTCGKGPVIKDLEFEQDVKFWILEQRDSDNTHAGYYQPCHSGSS